MSSTGSWKHVGESTGGIICSITKLTNLAFVRGSYSPRLYIGISCWFLTLLLAPVLRPWYTRWMFYQTAASEWVQRYIGTRSEVMRHCRRTQTKLDCAESSRSSLYAAAVHASNHPIHAGAVLMGTFAFSLTIYSHCYLMIDNATSQVAKTYSHQNTVLGKVLSCH